MQKNRFWELEGLRGVAAIVVVAYHYLLAFYALAFLGRDSIYSVGQNMRFEDNIYGSPVGVFLSGAFAVAIFFVLSGFVLSIGFFQTGKLEIIKKLAAKRYLRLMLPALASILIAFVLISFGLSHNQAAGEITQSGWLATAWAFTPNIFEAIKDGVFGIFVETGNGYNNVLWTMTAEFLGSFIVFGFLALFSTSKYKTILYAFLLVATFNTWLMAFILGMILADLYSREVFRQKIRRWFFFVPLLLLALFLGGYPQFGGAGLYQRIYPQILGINWGIVSLVVGATLLVMLVLGTTQLAKVFSNKVISKLGRYTFSLYLVHLMVLYTVTTALFLLLDKTFGFGYNAAALLSIIISIPVIYIVTILFEKYVDSKSIAFSSYVGGILMGTVKTPRLHKRLRKSSKRVKAVLKKIGIHV